MLKSQSEIDQGEKTIGKVVYDSLLIPMKICMQDPAVLFTNLYTSLIYGIYYSYFEAFPLVYIGDYGFNLGEQGIVFVCIVVGAVIGIVIYCSYVWFYLEPDIKKNGLRAQEHRLVPALFAVILLPAGLFLFAWTARPSIHWIVSIIGITMFACGAFILWVLLPSFLYASWPCPDGSTSLTCVEVSNAYSCTYPSATRNTPPRSSRRTMQAAPPSRLVASSTHIHCLSTWELDAVSRS
jgi:DHA1 family multidrug resistance protein-like MFS transporter